MAKIYKIHSRQIIDSRGTPTVEVECHLDDGTFALADVPSGASTGEHEALELRDKTNQYFGKSVYKALSNVNDIIAPALIGNGSNDIYEIDQLMFDLDGTYNKQNLGANAILGVSLACLKAFASSQKMQTFEFIKQISKTTKNVMPIPMMNILNGGSHADNNVDIQEFMIYPSGFKTFSESLQCGCEVFNTLKTVLKQKGYSTSVGDEGGFAPNLKSNQEALDLLMEAIEKSNYRAGKEVFLTLDVASSEFFKDTKPFPVHRLDKETSGIMIISKNHNSARLLTTLFRLRKIHKTYLAVCHGHISKKKGELKNELITFENDKKKIEKAITYYKVLSETNLTSFLELKPVTGRKHQLRKQLALIDNPIVGDKKYILSNKKIKSDKDLMLHAYSLKFYINNKKFFYKASPPPEFNKYLNKKKLNILNF